MQSRPIRQNSHHRSVIASSLLLTLALSLGLYAIAGVKASTAQAHNGQTKNIDALDLSNAAAQSQAESSTNAATTSLAANAVYEAQSPEAVSPLDAILGQARRFAVFHGIEAGHHAQTWTFNKSFLWGDIGIGPGVRTEFSGGSSVIGDCYEQSGQAAGRGCADIKPGGGAPAHVPPTYWDTTVDLTSVVQDIRNAVSTVDALPARTLERISGGTTIASPTCGTLNVIRVTREVNVGGANRGMTIQGCPTDTFIFDVDGQWSSSGGRVRLSGGVPASNVLWVFKGRLNNSGNGGWAGTAIFDTADGTDNKGKDLTCADCTLLVLNGKLSVEGGSNLRWHPFTVFDYGDAPESYGTLYSDTNGAARHKFTLNGPRLGTAWDAETNGQSVDGDGADEDGVIEPPYIQKSNVDPVEMTVIATNPSVVPATLACWIDFNRDGVFANTGEHDSTTVPASSGPASYTLTFSDYAAPMSGDSYLRCRISTNEDAVADPVTAIPSVAPAPGSGNPMFALAKSSYLANDGWPDGEVEDYPVYIEGGVDAGQDYGDAPDASDGTGEGNYNTRRADGGPTHLIVEDLSLGAALPDLELYGVLQNATATADDMTVTDDEDAIPTLPVITTASTSVHLAVEATNNNAETDAAMQCWIDFDRNGVFNNPRETSGVTTVAAGSGTGTYTLSFSGFSTPTPGVSFIRCRIAFVATEVSEPQGTAYSGEIEDHMVQISDENSPVIR